MPAGAIQWDWATDRKEPAAAKIKLQKAKKSAWFFDEATVTFVIGGEFFHAWMPEYAVNIDKKWLKAIIVGDYDNGDWRIMIPEETVKSTHFLRVPKADQHTTVVAGWW